MNCNVVELLDASTSAAPKTTRDSGSQQVALPLGIYWQIKRLWCCLPASYIGTDAQAEQLSDRGLRGRYPHLKGPANVFSLGTPHFDCTHTPLNHPYINPSRMYIVIVSLVSFKVGRFISLDVETSCN